MTPKEVIEWAGEEVLEDEIADLHAEIAQLQRQARRMQERIKSYEQKLKLIQEYQVVIPEPHRTTVIANLRVIHGT